MRAAAIASAELCLLATIAAGVASATVVWLSRSDCAQTPSCGPGAAGAGDPFRAVARDTEPCPQAAMATVVSTAAAHAARRTTLRGPRAARRSVTATVVPHRERWVRDSGRSGAVQPRDGVCLLNLRALSSMR